MSRIWKETFAAILVCHLVKGFENNLMKFDIFICCSARPYTIINKINKHVRFDFKKISHLNLTVHIELIDFCFLKIHAFLTALPLIDDRRVFAPCAVLFNLFYVTTSLSIQDDYGIISFISAVKIAGIGLNLGIRNWRLALHFVNYRTFVQSFKSASISSVLPQS